MLCVNAGSSSLKLALLQAVPTITDLWRHSGPFDPTTEPDLGAARDDLERHGFDAPAIVVHRIVHGGATHRRAEIIDDALVADLHELISFAPLHQPACLAGVDAARRTFPDATHVACYDTAFHHTMPDVATHLGLPNTVWAQGIRRYGFHGLSYQHVVDTVGADRLGRAVVAHLGSGASLCAVADGRSVDTTMGLTPAGGVVMGTRVGDLDPGVLIRLLRRGVDGATPLDADGVEDLVNRRSGLLGLSGLSPDMVTLLAARQENPAADLALRIFCRHIAKAIAALAASLEGIETLVFTGGIGEHAAPVRAEVCAPLGFLGIHIDATANETRGRAGDNADADADAGITVLSAAGADVTVLVVTADEERVMTRQAIALLR